MNILITGADGFIGTALRNYFKIHKFSLKVFAVERRSSAPHFLTCDLNSPHQLKKILRRVKPHVIFHLAGGRHIDNDMVWKANFVLTKKLLDAVKDLKSISPCIIIPGSAAEYGQVKKAQNPVSESALPRPFAWYGFVKYMQVCLGLAYARKGLDVRIARIFNVSGYGSPSRLALGNFAEKITEVERGKKPAVLKVDDLSGLRDFIDIEDVCSALWAIARKGKKGEVYNVCSGKGFRMRLLLRKLISYSHIKNIVVKEEQKAHTSTFDIVGSNTKIKRATSWRPRISLEQSLKNTLQYHRGL